jgi:hypothetical protein
VWYVDDSAGAGDGSSVSPFDSLATATAAAAANDTIFLYTGATPYTGGETLAANETLVGQPAGLTVNYENLIGASSAAAPQITGSGVGLTLTGGDELDDVDIEHTGGDGVNMANGTFVIENVGIADAGADAISGTGNTSVTITDSTITASAADGIQIVDGTGVVFQDFNLVGNTITGTHGAAISLATSGSANGNIDGNVIGTGSTSGGTLTAGSGSATGDGIDLTGNGSNAWLYTDVFNNAVYGIAAGSGIDADASGGATLQLPLTANYVYTDATSQGNAVTISAGTSASDVGTVCVDPSNNTATAKGSGNGMEVEEPDAGSTFGIQGYVNGSGFAGVATALESFNTLASAGGAQALANPGGATFDSCTVEQPDI